MDHRNRLKEITPVILIVVGVYALFGIAYWWLS